MARRRRAPKLPKIGSGGFSDPSFRIKSVHTSKRKGGPGFEGKRGNGGRQRRDRKGRFA